MAAKAKRQTNVEAAATAAAALSFFISTLDTGIVTVALPQIAGSFHTAARGAALSVTSYAAGVSATILVFGWLADRWGIRAVSACGFGLFAVFSAACSLSGTLMALIAFRALCGVAAAMLQATAGTFVAAYVVDRRQAAAFGTVSAILSLGPVLGPSLGGLLISVVSWRWVFAVAIPLCLMGLYLVLKLPRQNTAPTHLKGQERPRGLRRAFPFVCAVGLGASFVAVFVGAPFALTRAGFSAWQTGIILLACPFGAMLAAKFGAFGLRKGLGAPQALLGLAVCALAAALLLFVAPQNVMVFAVVLFVFGLGSGTLQTPTIALSLEAFPPSRRAFAGALQRFVQNVAISATAVCTGVLIDRAGVASAWGLSCAASLLTAAVALPLTTRRPGD